MTAVSVCRPMWNTETAEKNPHLGKVAELGGIMLVSPVKVTIWARNSVTLDDTFSPDSMGMRNTEGESTYVKSAGTIEM